MKCTVFCTMARFSGAIGCGARRGRVYTHGASLGPGHAPWHVLWAFKVA